MDLKDFLSLIQLAAGLNAAYIVVGISQGYTNILLNRVFNIKRRIEDRFSPIKAAIKINQVTLENTEPSEIDGRNTNSKIEMVKRGYEVLSSKIDRVEKEIEDTANLSFEFRCFSGLSLMMFLYCCTLLFIAPFYSDWFLLLFTAFVLCHSLMGCCKGDIILVCNLMWVIFEFIIILVLSLVAYSFSIRYNCLLLNYLLYFTMPISLIFVLFFNFDYSLYILN